MRHRVAAALALLLTGVAPALSAQERAPSRFAELHPPPAPLWGPMPRQAPRPAQVGQDSPGTMVGYAVLLGTAGFFAGALAGYALETSFCDPCHEWSGFPGLYLGAGLGESIGVAAGVHLGNHRRGSLPLDALASVGAGAAGVAVAAALGHSAPLFFTPLAQIIASAAVERRTARRNDP